MRSLTVSCTVAVPLAGSDGTQPVDRAALATWLRRVQQSPVLAELASAVEQATGDTASVRVRMDAADADRVRRALFDLIDSSTNVPSGWREHEILTARKAAYGLRRVARAWDACTGYDPLMRRVDSDMSEEMGGGYRRRAAS